jgi:Raf kinase inhibitor-like YbhB/YbcL family protein
VIQARSTLSSEGEGEDISPALSWSDPPAGTRALALIVDDPAAPRGTFTHWVAWNIDPTAGGWRRASRYATTSERLAGAGGCPPPRQGPHRYLFRVHAVDAEVRVAFQAGRRELERAIAGHVLSTAELMGSYER